MNLIPSAQIIATRCPMAGLIPTDDSVAVDGLFERAFARVSAWPMMLTIAQPPTAGSPPAARTPGRF